jgi:hypothetical protein
MIDHQFPKRVVEADDIVVAERSDDSPESRFDYSPGQTKVCHSPAYTYFGWSQVSCSQLKKLLTPLEYYHEYIAKDAPKKSNQSLGYGTLLHALMELGEEQFWDTVIRAKPEHCTATGALSAAGRRWAETLEGPEPLVITPGEEQKLRDQTARMLELPAVQRILDARVDAEFNIRFPWNGHDCRSRIDGATPEFFFDWKTTRDKDIGRNWWRSCKQFNYHLQSAFYAAAATAAGWPHHRMRFIVTSTQWPYECMVVRMPHEMIEFGRQECLRLLDELQARKEWGWWHNNECSGESELFVPRSVLNEMRMRINEGSL